MSGGSAGLSLPPEAFFGIEIARKVEVGGGGVQSGALRDLRAERRAPCSVELTSYPPLSGHSGRRLQIIATNWRTAPFYQRPF